MSALPSLRTSIVLTSACVGTLWLGPTDATAQEDPPPTPEELAELAEVAESLPLFASDEPLAVTLLTDIEWLREERSDEEEVDGTATFLGPDGVPVTVPVEVRTRGEFRRDKRNCNFPPLRLDFPRGEVEGTVFHEQDKLKLVTPCQDSRDDYQQYVLQEYLVYKVFNLLSPVSFRVRLVDITYVDVNDAYESRTKQAFLIESDEHVAQRYRGRMEEWEFFHPYRYEPEQAAVVALFQYMIGNTDWSGPYSHNTKLVRSAGGQYYPIPYDFDFSGVVRARYATPDPTLDLRSVRERLFRGFCREDTDHAALKARFEAQREAIWALYGTMPGLEPDRLEETLEYYEGFYETLAEEGRYEREVIRSCRDVPGP